VFCAVLFIKVFVNIITLLKRKIVRHVLLMKYGTIILSMILKRVREGETGRKREVFKYEAQFISH